MTPDFFTTADLLAEAAETPVLRESLEAQTAAAVSPDQAALPEATASRRDAAVGLLQGVAPVDDVEGMLAAQMVSAHNAAMECLARAALPERTEGSRARDLRIGARLLAIYSWQVRTLDVWQRKRAPTGPAERILVGWLESDMPSPQDPMAPGEPPHSR
ncbi:MAG: hypothetical protein H8D70_01030 [Rhodospirillaceae bacterium]|nr:hypothetical protein [Rhodospirillaceae bacterium]